MVKGLDDVKMVLDRRQATERKKLSFLDGRYRSYIALYETKLSVKESMYMYDPL